MHQALGPVHRHSIPGRHAYPEVSSQRFAPLPSYPEYASASNGVVAIPRPKPSIQLADIDPALYQNEATDPVTPRHGHTPQLVLRSATATANLVSDAASSSPVITEESESSQVEIPEPNDDKESIHPYKELPSGKPLVWSAKRQGLCEAVPYYRSYKGSLYPIEKVAAGYLIDAETDPGDVFDAQIIISSVGGGRTRDRETNTMVRLEDIPDDTLQVQAFKAAMELNRLLYPCRPPAPYAVLDYFRVTDLWKQKMVSTGATNGYVWVWRMRFEKANLSTPSWWMPAGKEMPATADLTIRAPVKECAFCRQATKEMFEVGWFCMNQHCPNNYTLAGGTEVDWQAPLKHTEAFLNERTPSPGSVPSLVPEMVDDTTLHGTEMACRRGFVCPLCGCCNRRIFWNRLVCENSDCGWERLAAMKPYPSETLDQENQVFDERTLRTTNRNDVNLDVVDFYHQDIHATMHIKQIIPHSHSIDFGSHIARQYFLPDAEGKIIGSFTIFSATKETNAQPGGPDELFRNLELQDFGLRRNPAAVAGTKYEGLTRHFQMNFGARYKFGVTVQSKGFNEAPAQILMALQRLIWAKNQAVMYSNAFIGSQDAATVSQSALLGDHQDFNELLALGYMEEDRIRYHDDGEDELGPIVSALALGSPCLMSFRPKAKQQFPESLKKGSQPKKDPKKKCEFHDVLQVRMKHGDMMVMAGTEIQKVYEHTVIPQGNRRFALTARYIDPTKMASQEDREDAITKGAVPDWARQFEYQGN
ncbi:hypothetical protein QBC35DRAFT_385243 [Podospora australis]|uniref:Alpha-ketoglutarate-dependent dioxygenase AlkB-like domain-containing protein n=1 Tax=Podospora australis TaxID=1536484 RepID=A0AAN6WSG4_9PEZI|nr:hypothetical protein QBC35DRAFT_385243 [Podospora australis]